jgi:alkylation response protein AidB-like acyl-CoA dehydrogenase
MTGGSHFNEVFLTDVRIPAENILGEVDAGWGVAMTTLANERVFIGGGGSGAGFNDLLALAEAQGRMGEPLIRQGIAAAYTRYEILRYLGMRVRTATSKGQTPGAEASVMKLFYAGHLKRLGDLAMAIEGTAGTLIGADAPAAGAWQQQLLSAPSIRIAGGSDEVQRNIMGERVLGLPGEPRVDKGVAWRDTQRQG